MNDAGRLFGTSGIRGVFSSTLCQNPVHEFVHRNVLTPELAYIFAEALAELHRESGNSNPVEIWRDVRESGTELVEALLDGFDAHQVMTSYRGIAPTTLYSVKRESWVVVVTASHNPIEFNGLKVFREGRPLERHLEKQLERIMLEKASRPRVRRDLKRRHLVCDKTVCAETRALQIRHLETHSPINTLRQAFANRRDKVFLPLDLAFGAAACPVAGGGRISVPSPQIAILLHLGIPIIGYGCTQDPTRTNDRIGAAYAYCETANQPEPHEMPAFAHGQYGYGAPAERIVFWPENVYLQDSAVRRLFEDKISDAIYSIPCEVDISSETIWVLHIDRDTFPSDLKDLIETDICRRSPLPGFMVDCDADRILVTTPQSAVSPIPYLTGDAMIRFFAETVAPGTYDEIAFTVESGMALDVALERLRDRHSELPEGAFMIRKVAVGDRAIIDCFMDAGPGNRMGGEPSGHIIFSKNTPETHDLIDDPFITYLLMLSRLIDQNEDLDAIMERFFCEVPEVFCARKPDSHAGCGLNSAEKSSLELWRNGVWGNLSDYAAGFIPFYIARFAETTGEVFNWGQPDRIALTEEWRNLMAGKAEIQADGWLMPLARIYYRDTQVDAELFLDKRDWAGPEVIRIEFFYLTDKGKGKRIGEGVFRNSGTSPKNAGYHKLWIENPKTSEKIPHQRLIDALTELATRRAAFTDDWVNNVLRKNESM